MPRPTRPSILAFVTLAVTTLLLGACGDEAVRLRNGDPAPNVELRGMNGESLRFPEDFAGKAVAIRFWADWCRFCKDEMTAIEPVYQRLRAEGMEVLAVNVGQSREVAQAFLDKLEISYGTALDEASATARAFGVLGLPTTYFVDRQGLIRHKILGESEAATFERLARELL